ncbi:MAG: outer membrane beta-barrel protein [Flavobacteriales bacterium]
MTQTKMCKELGLWALLWVGVLTSAWGQGHGFRMGLAMDPNVSWMNSRDFEHTTDGGRAHFGYQFMADIMFSETYAFGTGVHVFRTGSQIEYWEPTTDSTLSRVSRDFNNQYVELPLTFKFRTKEIGYTTYFGRFGTGLGLNTRRAAEEVRYVGYTVEDGTWSPVANPAIPSPDNISADFATLFRASLIVGVGLERKIAGPTSLMVGLTYNNSLFNTHKGLDVVKVDGTGVPRFSEAGEALTTALDGHDSYLALSVGIVF